MGLGWARDGWLVMVAGRLSRQDIYIYNSCFDFVETKVIQTIVNKIQ